jgi:hypothetical protein
MYEAERLLAGYVLARRNALSSTAVIEYALVKVGSWAADAASEGTIPAGAVPACACLSPTFRLAALQRNRCWAHPSPAFHRATFAAIWGVCVTSGYFHR